MTPHLTTSTSIALSEKEITTAWMTAMLTRVEKLPKLDDLLGSKKTERDHKKMESDLKNALGRLKNG
jgi:hypothetical protein